jgi:hypothetical protein
MVVHQLVQTDETLWLRLLGREGKQKMAIAEFSQVPTENDLYANCIPDVENVVLKGNTSFHMTLAISIESIVFCRRSVGGDAFSRCEKHILHLHNPIAYLPHQFRLL